MGKKWVISDIHGCLDTLRVLVETQIVPGKDDTLIFLGDYIDRGPHSKGVIDYIMQLQQQEFSVVPLKGNHEDFMVKAYRDEKQQKGFLFWKKKNRSKEMWLRYGGKQAMESFRVSDINMVPEKYINWMADLPLFHELDKWLVVHAGLNFEIDDPYEDKNAMLWVREYKVKPEKIGNRRMVHGHVPVSLEFIHLTLRNDNYPFIDLDNGCYMSNKSGYGNLVALELDSLMLKVQANIDME